MKNEITTCPCCNAKVIVTGKITQHYTSLPQPDLTNLKEVYDKYKKVIPDMKHISYSIFATVILPPIWEAVKELIEQEEK